MNAQQALEYMKTTGNQVKFAGGSLWASLGDFVYEGCFIDGCTGCDGKDEIADWLNSHEDTTDFEAMQ